ncbi:MAG: DUF2157 domain-containing protein [Gammaproteobacteria bacterium]|nr:DUF2157 domain-containing protein [Gammaproteobacteria bacterium]
MDTTDPSTRSVYTDADPEPTATQGPVELELADLAPLSRAGVLPPSRYTQAAYLCRDWTFWSRWATHALLALALAHLLAGIVFFFAYNWRDLSAVVKFTLLESAVIASVGAAAWARLDSLAGQALLIAASVLVGVLLAVVGQVYQTGADAYELFSWWALLVTPWVLISRCAPHWLIWLVLVHTGFALYGEQVLIPLQAMTRAQLSMLHGLATLGVLAVREFAVARGCGWLAPHWTRLTLLFAALSMLLVPAAGYLLESHAQILPALVLPCVGLAAILVYTRLRADFPATSLITGCMAVFVIALLWRLIEISIGFDSTPAWRLLVGISLLGIGCVAVAAASLKLLTALGAGTRRP